MNDNSSVITTLCSHLCSENCKPLEPSEWTKFANHLMAAELQPKDVINFDNDDYRQYLSYNDLEIERIKRLFDRAGSLSFELQKYASMGINVITRADREYPLQLKRKLKEICPPMFYYSGNLELTKKLYIGFVGSRTVSDEDVVFTEKTVKKVISYGYGIVSGGAKGIDSVSSSAALNSGGYCIEFICDSFAKKIKKREILSAIQNGNLLIMSTTKPDAGFNTGMAMQRNKYIYVESEGTVVIKSDYKKGGTWNGASEAIKKEYCPVLCRADKDYSGNVGLIGMGAIPITDEWNGDISGIKNDKPETYEQLSLFDIV